jgi:hypothetical protein
MDRRGAILLLAAVAASSISVAETKPLAFQRLYKSFGVRGLVFSDEVVALNGAMVSMRGFMAPPLKAMSRFFVLTAEPMALCPFCQSDADWPVDIVVVKARSVVEAMAFDRLITVTGRLEVGSATDPDTGFVSQIRIVEASFTSA